jgi:hypothetical protein
MAATRRYRIVCCPFLVVNVNRLTSIRSRLSFEHLFSNARAGSSRDAFRIRDRSDEHVLS